MKHSVNETSARFYFRNANPMGKKVRFANYPSRDPVYEIIGVVNDAKHDSLREQPSRFLYIPIPQSIDRINRLASPCGAQATPPRSGRR